MDPHEPVVVYTTNNPAQAEIIKNVLEAEGIHCDIDGENQAGFTGVFEMRLLAPAGEAERARQLIESQIE